MTETYRAWRPEDWPNALLYLHSLVDRSDRLIITLESENFSVHTPVIQIHFGFPRLYRNIDEGYRLKQQSEFQCNRQSVVYTVENSPLVAELQEQSLGTLEGWDLIHYLIATANDWIDVVSEVEPHVRKFEEGTA